MGRTEDEVRRHATLPCVLDRSRAERTLLDRPSLEADRLEAGEDPQPLFQDLGLTPEEADLDRPSQRFARMVQSSDPRSANREKLLAAPGDFSAPHVGPSRVASATDITEFGNSAPSRLPPDSLSCKPWHEVGENSGIKPGRSAGAPEYTSPATRRRCELPPDSRGASNDRGRRRYRESLAFSLCPKNRVQCGSGAAPKRARYFPSSRGGVVSRSGKPTERAA